MSFPRLVLTGADGVISSIDLAYDNDEGPDKPGKLTRLEYTVRRQARNFGVAGGTKLRYPDTIYDQARLMHTWIGYADVLTESVCLTPSATSVEQTTVELIKTALLYNGGGVAGATAVVEHTVKHLTSEDLGPGNPSSGGVYVDAEEPGTSWQYGETPDLKYVTTKWFVNSISIKDNGDNTSRVVFAFEIVTPWQKLEDVIV